jgi:hypothetical protein
MLATINGYAAKLASTILDARWLAWTMVFFAAIAWMATPVILARGVLSLAGWQEAGLALGAALCFVGVVFMVHRQAPALGVLAARLMEGKQRLLLLVLIGLVLRVGWVIAFNAQPSSDGLTYLELAKKLVNGQSYETSGTLAYWPPGYAFFLALFLLPFPPGIAIPVSQLGLFCVAAVGVYRLTERLSSSKAALIAVGLFCLWPNLIAHSATPEKELLVATLLIWAIIGATGVWTTSAFIAGLLLGAMTLVQPSTLLLIPAMCALLLIRRAGRAPLPIAVLLLGAALVIAPWTVRNHEVLGGFKLVSTNGGGNFYRANNSLANGGYTPVGEVDLSHLSELDADRVGKELATRWIKEHPARFLGLVIEKQVRFMGDDAAGVYSTFRGDDVKRSQMAYLALKLAANFWWLAIWAGIAALVIMGAQLGKASFLAWGWMYLFVLHSIFESAGKYHVPVLWIPCVILAVLLADIGQRSLGARHGRRI